MKKLFVLCLSLAVVVPMILADEAELPTAEALMEQYVEAIGGKENMELIQTQISKGNFEIPAMGIKASLLIYNAAPGNMLTIAESDAIGKIESGCVDGIVWENSTMMGGRIKEGAEKADAIREAAFDKLTNWKKYYESAVTVGKNSVNGSLCYQLLLKPKEGTPETYYLNANTHLLDRIDTDANTPMGTVHVQSFISRYSDVSNVKMPSEIRVEVMGQERIIKLDSVLCNVKIDPAIFEIPDEIKALIEQDK